MDARELIEIITAAFPLKPVPAQGLHASHAADAHYFGKVTLEQREAAAASDAGRQWPRYSDEELATLDAAMSHLIDEVFVYYLPAYLCAAARHVSADIDDPWGPLVGHACFQVTNRSAYNLSRLGRLTERQVSAVIKFLEFIVERADSFESDLARKSLERYWKNPQRSVGTIIAP